MIKCPICKKDTSRQTITVYVCPHCHTISNAQVLCRRLKEVGISNATVRKIEKEIKKINDKAKVLEPTLG